MHTGTTRNQVWSGVAEGDISTMYEYVCKKSYEMLYRAKTKSFDSKSEIRGLESEHKRSYQSSHRLV